MNYSLFFDDIVKDEYGTWTQVCQHHSESNLINSLGKLKDCPSENTICGCIECQNKARLKFKNGYKTIQCIDCKKTISISCKSTKTCRCDECQKIRKYELRKIRKNNKNKRCS